MKRTSIVRGLLVLAVSGVAWPAAVLAEDKPATVHWSARQVSGALVNVPVSDRPTVLVFVRPDQKQSQQAMEQIKRTVDGSRPAQVVVVVSGPRAAEHARLLSQSDQCPWAVVADPDYAASGQMSVHVWPTTLIIQPKGEQLAHLAGMPKSYALHLAAYLDAASGRIDQAGLQQRLASHEVIGDSREQMASRHLHVAQRLVDEGRGQLALAEADQGLKLQANDPGLQLVRIKALLLLRQPKEAMEILDSLPAGSAVTWQVSLLRGRALVMLEKWQEAKAILPEALKLNPNPAEAHYLLGLVYEHEKDWPHAAESFRRAFEATDVGRKSMPVARPVQSR